MVEARGEPEVVLHGVRDLVTDENDIREVGQLVPRQADHGQREALEHLAIFRGGERFVGDVLRVVLDAPPHRERAPSAVEIQEWWLADLLGRDVPLIERATHRVVAIPGVLIGGDEERLEPRHGALDELGTEELPDPVDVEDHVLDVDGAIRVAFPGTLNCRTRVEVRLYPEPKRIQTPRDPDDLGVMLAEARALRALATPALELPGQARQLRAQLRRLAFVGPGRGHRAAWWPSHETHVGRPCEEGDRRRCGGVSEACPRLLGRGRVAPKSMPARPRHP